MKDRQSHLGHFEQPHGKRLHPERTSVHPEHMDYLYSRLTFTQRQIDRFSRSKAVVPLDNTLEQARADLVRLQAAKESALRNDVSGIVADLQQQYQEKVAYIEKQREYIEQHPIGTLYGDTLYLELKDDIQRGEKALEKVKGDSYVSDYIQRKLGEDRHKQATTQRGIIMTSVYATQKELNQIKHLQQLLPQAQVK